MTCHEHEADLVDLARSGEPIGHAADALRAHLGGCADCAARFERERRLTAGLRALARQAEEVAPNPVAERRLMEIFEAERHVPTGRTVPSTGWSDGEKVLTSGRRVNGMWALAAAAVLVLCVGAGWTAVRWTRANSGGQAPPVGVDAAASTPDGSRQAVAAAPRVGMPPVGSRVPAGLSAGQADTRPPALVSTALPDASRVRPSQAASRRLVSGRAGSPAAEETGDFMALPAADRLPGFESGMIVRVELPVSSLPAYGLEIVPDAARTPVRADVLVGQDGQPRAIRLVSMGSGPRRIR